MSNWIPWEIEPFGAQLPNRHRSFKWNRIPLKLLYNSNDQFKFIYWVSCIYIICVQSRCTIFMENNRVKDIDGNKYNTITIGSQEWMAENLKVTHYRNGDSIANIIGGEDWATTDIGAYCIYKKSYGALYNWHATVDTRNIAPEGWHVPTDAEWTKLENYLKLHHPKSIMKSLQSASGWKDNTNGTDNYGFTVLPGGHRAYSSGFFLGIGNGACFWSSTKSSDNGAYNRRFHNSNIYRNFGEHVRAGCSIRCLRDQSI